SFSRDWSSDVCSSDLDKGLQCVEPTRRRQAQHAHRVRENRWYVCPDDANAPQYPVSLIGRDGSGRRGRVLEHTVEGIAKVASRMAIVRNVPKAVEHFNHCRVEISGVSG